MQNLLTARIARATAALTAGSLLALSASAQTTYGDGFAQTATQAPPASGSYETLPNGDRVVFDGTSFDLYDGNNVHLMNLGTLPAFVFNSFVEVDPTQTFAIIGESSNGDLFKVQLDGSGFTTLANLNFNFDGVFDSPNTILVSAALCGFGCGNDIVRVDTDTGATTNVANLPGPSGPVAIGLDGSLFYGLGSDIFPPPAGSASVVSWTQAQIQGPAVLGIGDADLVLGNLDGASSLAVDPVYGNVFLGEGVFGGTSRILEIAPFGAGLIDVVLETDLTLGNLELMQDAGDGHFHRYQPADGVFLHHSLTDFGAINEVATVRAQQPTTSFNQVGSLATVSIAGGEPNGAALVVFTQNMFYDPNLITQTLGNTGFQFHAIARKNRLRRSGPLLLPLDANGAADFQYFDPGSLAGKFAFQALITDANGKILGGSTAVQN